MTVKSITGGFFLATAPQKQHIGFLHSVCSSGTNLDLSSKGNGNIDMFNKRKKRAKAKLLRAGRDKHY